MSDQKLWNDLRSNPANAKSSMQVATELRAQEHARTLQGLKPAVTAEQRAEAERRFDAINAANLAAETVEATGIVETRKTEIQEMILAALKDTTTFAESTEVCRRAAPLLTRFATTMNDYQITIWVGHTVQALREEKEAQRLAGL